MKLTDNFSLSEFRCKDGTDVPEMYLENVKELAKNLQKIRYYVNAKFGHRSDIAIKVISGYRTESHNAKVGGAKKSLHLKAMASDIKPIGKISLLELFEVIKDLQKQGMIHEGGLKMYKTFIHYDIGKKRTW
jgi:uncharacterized protein YcbK (DUF882 family)